MISIKNVSYSYLSNDELVQNLKDINLEINAGEVVVLCGESGSGKTTLTRVINGLIPNFYEGEMSGEVTVGGQNVTTQTLETTSKTVGSIFQNPRSQFFNVDTTGEVVFGCENLALPIEETLKRLKEVSDLFELENLLNRSIFELSGGEKQRIACASIYAVQPEVFVFDEPSSNLDVHSIELLRKAIEILVKNKKTVVIAEHRLYYLADLATRYVYMSEGKIQCEFSPAEMKSICPKQRKLMGLRNINFSNFSERKESVAFKESCSSKLHIEQLKVKYENTIALDISDLSIPLHTVVGIVGENGAGKSTFVNALVGLKKSNENIFLESKPIKKKERLKKGFMVMQEVGHQLFTQSVSEELKLNIPEENYDIVDEVIEKLSLTKFKDRHPMSLSGGEKQRVAIASAFCAGKEILMYDEPTSGLDYKNMIKTSELIKAVSQKSKCSILITHDLEFILSCCDYIVELKNGSVADSYDLDKEGINRICGYFKK